MGNTKADIKTTLAFLEMLLVVPLSAASRNQL
jgi:hypothetical protein